MSSSGPDDARPAACCSSSRRRRAPARRRSSSGWSSRCRTSDVALLHSRPARPGESDGVDYNFVTRERFEAMIAAASFSSGRTSSATCTAPARPTPSGCSRRARRRAGHRRAGRAQVRRAASRRPRVRDAAVLRGAGAAAARPQQGQRGGNPAAAGGGPAGGRGVRRVRLRRRQRRARRPPSTGSAQHRAGRTRAGCGACAARPKTSSGHFHD